jgi:hypothetical protein
VFGSVTPTAAEVATPRPGDDLVPRADVVMDRAFTLAAPPETVWPWIVQLGKQRAGWYFPRSVERFITRSRRAARSIDPRWQMLAVGDRIPDYGPDGYFDVAQLEAPATLVYAARRGRIDLTWSISLAALDTGGTRVVLRLRLGTVRHQSLARGVGGQAGDRHQVEQAAGLRERLAS